MYLLHPTPFSHVPPCSSLPSHMCHSTSMSLLLRCVGGCASPPPDRSGRVCGGPISIGPRQPEDPHRHPLPRTPHRATEVGKQWICVCMEELGKALICLYYVCYACWGPVCCGTTRCCSRTGTDARSTIHTPSFLSAKPQRTACDRPCIHFTSHRLAISMSAEHSQMIGQGCGAVGEGGPGARHPPAQPRRARVPRHLRRRQPRHTAHARTIVRRTNHRRAVEKETMLTQLTSLGDLGMI